MYEDTRLIELKGISKAFGETQVLHNVDMYIRRREFVTLLGPSGCGKTTMLRIIGGFETPDQGDVIFMGEKINNVPPHKRHVNTVFQRYALFPHLNVFENVAFPLRERKVPRKEIKEKVDRMLKMVMLSGFAERRVTSLSGGQQQRVAIARALVNEPKLIILDEPETGLDFHNQILVLNMVEKLAHEDGISAIMNTHYPTNAMRIADEAFMMNRNGDRFYGKATDILNETNISKSFDVNVIVDEVMYHDRKLRSIIPVSLTE